MPHFAIWKNKVWDFYFKKGSLHFTNFYLVREKEKHLIALIPKHNKEWGCIVQGQLPRGGERFVDGFKTRFKAAEYALKMKGIWGHHDDCLTLFDQEEGTDI